MAGNTVWHASSRSGVAGYTVNCYIRVLYVTLATLKVDSNGMVWYGMVNVDLYSAIITKVSNTLNASIWRKARFSDPV